jgi:penicillin-binding protein 1A
MRPPPALALSLAHRLKAFSILRYFGLLAVFGIFLGAGFTFRVYRELSRDLPDRLDKVLDYRPARASRVYSADGELIGELFLHKRVIVPIARVPAHVQNAFIAAEDRRFHKHVGFDPVGITRAAYENYVAGGIRQGASTITQQVARMLMLTQEKTVIRKLKEIILSIRVERELAKDEILHIYLNHVYLGHGAYGVQAAAENYFGKDVEHLTLAEVAMLAGLPKAPTRFSPYNDYARARERQAYVLGRMLEDGIVTAAEVAAAREEPLALLAREQPLNAVAAPYFVEFIRRWAQERYGHHGLFDGGLRISTTVDMSKQRAAEAALRRGLEDLDRRLGFRGPVGRLADASERDAFANGPPRPYVISAEHSAVFSGGALLPEVAYVGMVSEIVPRRRVVTVDLGPRTLRLAEEDAGRLLRWRDRKTTLAVGDLIPVRVVRDEKKGELAELAAFPDVQAALVALDHRTGDVLSMVGGYDYAHSVFNRAVQARRQAGSSIKPFIYAAALQRGYTNLSIVHDAPVAVRTATGVWAPSNYDAGKYLGAITMKTALAKSINTVAVRLVAGMGVDTVTKSMRSLGITTPIPRHISISLGTPDVSLLQMTAAYAAFPAGGQRVSPRFVTLVTADDGRVIDDWRTPAARPQALPPAIAYLMVDLMKGVVARGTARQAQVLGRPAGGKTGTSTGFRDVWFIGFTPDLVAGVWVGRDNFKPIGHKVTGGNTALPIWVDYMRAAHPDTPVRDFVPPADVTFVRASDTSGEPVGPGAPNASWVPFARGTVPGKFGSSIDARQFSTSVGFQ